MLHPKSKKSASELSLKEIISGSAITTLGTPPKIGSFASTSPKVRLTYMIS